MKETPKASSNEPPFSPSRVMKISMLVFAVLLFGLALYIQELGPRLKDTNPQAEMDIRIFLGAIFFIYFTTIPFASNYIGNKCLKLSWKPRIIRISFATVIWDLIITVGFGAILLAVKYLFHRTDIINVSWASLIEGAISILAIMIIPALFIGFISIMGTRFFIKSRTTELHVQ